MRDFPSFIAQLARGTAAALVLVAMGLPAGGCASGEGKDAVVLWSLIDRRSCMDTAVVQVAVDLEGGATSGVSATGPCRANPAENQLQLRGVRAGAKLHARALSAQEAVLYRGERELVDPVPAVIELPLYYTGGE